MAILAQQPKKENFVQCAWEIVGPVGSSITIDFDTFSLTTAQFGFLVPNQDSLSAFGGTVMIVGGQNNVLPSSRTFATNRVGILFNAGPAPTAAGFSLRSIVLRILYSLFYSFAKHLPIDMFWNMSKLSKVKSD